jgi:hypothetical protein
MAGSSQNAAATVSASIAIAVTAPARSGPAGGAGAPPSLASMEIF